MGLSPKEKAIFRAGGVSGLDDSADQNKIAFGLGQERLGREWQCLLQDALDEDDAALLLGLSREKLRENIQSRQLKLHTIAHPTGDWVFPLWQFSKDGLIPHLDELIGALSPEVHPVTVCQFMTTENRDLETDTSDCCFSPREWLVRGYDLAPVIVQAKDL